MKKEHISLSEGLLLGFFVLLKFVLQYQLINPIYDLQRDEYLHLDQANHLAWGYLSVPPFTSWVSYIIQLLGNSVFWVKFFPALFGALTIVVAGLIIRELKGGLYAQLLAATAITFSVILRINILYQPNSFDILSYTLIYLALIKYIHTQQSKWLLYGAVFFALGFLNKYNILFLMAGLLPAILLTRHRSIFVNKIFYIAILLALVLIAPNIFWQYQNGFPVVHHMQELSARQLVNVNRWDFLQHQFLFFFSSVFVLLAAFIAFFIYPPFKKYRVVGWSYLFTIILFVYFKAKDYYAIGLYPVLIVFGSVYIESWLSKGKRYYIKPALPLVIAGLFIPLVPVLFPLSSPEEIQQKAQKFKALGMLRWEDGKDHILPQDFADMLGWKELAHKVMQVYDSLPNKKETLIIADNYGQAGAINYYSNNKLQAVSFNADYINWFPKHRSIKNIIAVEGDGVSEQEKRLFKTIIFKGSIENPFAREYGTAIYLLTNGPDSLNQLLHRVIAQEKSKFQY